MIDKLAQFHCTQEEIAAVVKVSVDTINSAAKRERSMSLSEIIKEKAGIGKAALRKMQWKAASKGNIVALIWLGKQYLDQRDHREQTIGNPEEMVRVIREMVAATLAVAP